MNTCAYYIYHIYIFFKAHIQNSKLPFSTTPAPADENQNRE